MTYWFKKSKSKIVLTFQLLVRIKWPKLLGTSSIFKFYIPNFLFLFSCSAWKLKKKREKKRKKKSVHQTWKRIYVRFKPKVAFWWIASIRVVTRPCLLLSVVSWQPVWLWITVAIHHINRWRVICVCDVLSYNCFDILALIFLHEGGGHSALWKSSWNNQRWLLVNKESDCHRWACCVLWWRKGLRAAYISHRNSYIKTSSGLMGLSWTMTSFLHASRILL